MLVIAGIDCKLNINTSNDPLSSYTCYSNVKFNRFPFHLTVFSLDNELDRS